jgi:hypothetical protein
VLGLGRVRLGLGLGIGVRIRIEVEIGVWVWVRLFSNSHLFYCLPRNELPNLHNLTSNKKRG